MRILELTRKEFAGGQLVYEYDSFGYYDVSAGLLGEGFSVAVTPKNAPRRHVSFATDIFSPELPEPTLFILVDNEGNRAGYLETNREAQGKTLRIVNLMVEDTSRRRGYGSLLLSRARTQARALGCRALRVRVPAGNFGGIRFLLGQGLTLTGYTALPDAPGAGVNEPTLELGELIQNA